MPEDQNGQEEQQEVIDTPEVQGEEQPEEVSASEEPTEAPQSEESELPGGVKERTQEQFEKLKAHNKQLAERVKQLEGSSQPIPSVLDYLAPVQVPQVPVAPIPQYVPQQYQQYTPQEQQLESLVDENQYVNVDVLQKRLSGIELAQKKAEEAERRALEAESRISKFEQDNETKALYQAYPELDPLSEVFDQDAYQMVRDRLTSQIVHTGKRNAMKAAEEMSKYFRKNQPVNEKVLEQRRQAATPGTTRQVPTTDFEDLKRRSMHDPNALLERLERIGA